MPSDFPFVSTKSTLNRASLELPGEESWSWSALSALLGPQLGEEGIPPGTLSAIAALQEASRSIIIAHERAVKGLAAAILDAPPLGASTWQQALESHWIGLDSAPHRNALIIAVQRENPALQPYRLLLSEPVMEAELGAVLDRSSHMAVIAPFTQPLGEVLRAPARAHPDDLWAQLDWVLERWADLIPDALRIRLLRSRDLHQEETRFRGFGPGPIQTAPFPVGGQEDSEGYFGAEDPGIRFSEDHDWMRRLVMVAKHTYVWLDQLSRRYEREIRTLDAIPDEELAALGRAGVTGIWLIGIWERSQASRSVKQRMGDGEALASAYSIWDYVVADALGGPAAADRLAERAWRHGIRMGADMVPNHVSLDGRWVAEHPERFIQVDQPPFPSYSFTGPNLSHDERMEVHLEDGYWDQQDAAVVFRHTDRDTGHQRYIYHGNDGTQMPWNDTAQLDYTRADTREAVIQSLLDVARRFPIIRLDAAMTLARKHVQRLWFPPPGAGGAIPSRSEHALSQEEFNARVPREFWVEVVERVAEEAPGTLLLAEAFWMMEGYFVKALGMHRVYHSAFMHMLRDGQNVEFRAILHNILEYGPAILERYANFMSNPDEESAAEQFGRDEYYLCVTTLTATLPGLPMIGHGQLEGFKEKYGMEYSRAKWEEPIDIDLGARHESFIFPLFRERERFSGIEHFHLFDHRDSSGQVNGDVYAFTNRSVDGRRSLVFVHHGGGWAEGGIHHSGLRNEGSIEEPSLVSRSFHEALGLRTEEDTLYGVWELHSRQWRLMRAVDLAEHGFRYSLGAYEIRVFMDFREIEDQDGTWTRLCEELGGRPVDDLDREWRRLHQPIEGRVGLPMRALSTELAVPGGLAPAVPPRGAGVLLHIGSLPGPEGVGTVGAQAHAMLDWLVAAGLRYWQLLPICEGGPGESPYSSPASLVGNPWLIDLTDLHAQGLLSDAGLEAALDASGGPVDMNLVRTQKAPALRAAAQTLLEGVEHPLHGAWLAWRDANPWVADSALFQVLRREQGGQPWWSWPVEFRDRHESTLEVFRAQHFDSIAVREVLAFLFDHQWSRFLEAAEQRGILLFGDLPIYVSRDSVDVWAHRSLFELDSEGLPERVSGVPPDAFSDTGQLWGNPLYDWARMAEDGFGWWIDRLDRCLRWTPVLRIDHFRAFAAYWAVPGDSETAMDGSWIEGPDLDIFHAFRNELGGQWLVAEDLGDIDEPVHELRRKAGLLCTRVLQFAFGSDDENLHLPSNSPSDSVLYTGTHDNDTTAGWWSTLPDWERERVLEKLECDQDAVVEGMIEMALEAPSQVVIIPAQDLLGLGSEARMNIPGVGEGNWSWRLDSGALNEARAADVYAWIQTSGRA
jgi:4-alpha-glucanotransferase